jgi:ArsR family transcriptional regulator, arsenate/arsenite/antimonite-responsive transcriptional repressor
MLDGGGTAAACNSVYILSNWELLRYGIAMTPKTSPKSPSSLKPEQVRAITKAIADPQRYAILQRIAREGATCADLRECCPITAATLSHHMKELEEAGLIIIARQGKFALPSFRRDVWKAYLQELSEL